MLQFKNYVIYQKKNKSTTQLIFGQLIFLHQENLIAEEQD